MLRKTLLILIILSTVCIVALTLNIFDSAEVDAEKTVEVTEISTKPSIVALATVMKSFRDSLSEELLSDASYPLGHKESYSWSNLPAERGEDRGDFSWTVIIYLSTFWCMVTKSLSSLHILERILQLSTVL